MKLTILGQKVEVTKDNVWDIQDELNISLTKLRQFGNNFAVCSRCDSTFDAQDERSQWTEDGVLCPDCHESYSIKHYCDGGVGVINNETGKPLPLSEIGWL